MHDVDLRGEPERLADHVVRGAGAWRSVGDRAGLRSRERDQLVERFCRHRGIDRKYHRHGNRLPYGLEVSQGIVPEPRLDRRIDDEARKHHEQRVTVARGARGELVADHRPGARTILGDHRLPETFRHVLPEEPARHVGRAARREGHDDAQGLRGKRLCMNGTRQPSERNQQRQK